MLHVMKIKYLLSITETLCEGNIAIHIFKVHSQCLIHFFDNCYRIGIRIFFVADDTDFTIKQSA